MYYDRREKDKNDPGQNLPDKNPGQNFPNKNNLELKQTPCKDICMYACTTKNRGVRDVWRTLGGSRDVWQSVTEEVGVKIGPKQRDVLYGRPLGLCMYDIHQLLSSK